MFVEDQYARFVAARAKPPPLTAGDMFHWDGRGTASRSVGRTHVSEPIECAAQLALPPATGHQASPAGSTRPTCTLLSPPAPAIDWAKEAARLTLYLDPELLLAPLHDRLPGATGALMWLHGQGEGEGLTSSVHPALVVHTVYPSLQVECAELVLHLPINDSLHYHIALLLQAAVDTEGAAGQLYAEALADALAVHFLRRYSAAQPARREVTGGITPYKLRRTLAYIQAHLEEKLSLATLAAVAQMSPTHFAHLFKHATGLAPHQYVSLSRIEHSKRLLAETDMLLIDISTQVGCADQSHFTALFRRHVDMTPNAYRSTTRGVLHKSCPSLFASGPHEEWRACSPNSRPISPAPREGVLL
jgi:AraC-like DNA-binding protein